MADFVLLDSTVKCVHVYRFDCDYVLVDLVNYTVLRNND